MRDDINKLIVERERYGHKNKYHNVRKMRKFDGIDADGELRGGREGMRSRHKVSWNTREFSENLNPLYGWVRSCLGKNWDKCYSELRQKFDARSVINNHILEHLFSYVNTKTKLIDGKPYCHVKYSRNGDSWIPVNEGYSDYYVCPKDGTLKKTHRQSRRSIIKQQEAEKASKVAEVFRELDKDTHLRMIDGVWFLFKVEDLPESKVEYRKPFNKDTFDVGLGRTRTWDELSGPERVKFGVRHVISGDRYDVFLEKTVSRRLSEPGYRGTRKYPGSYVYGLPTPGVFRYYCSKETASHKILKKAGVVQ